MEPHLCHRADKPHLRLTSLLWPMVSEFARAQPDDLARPAIVGDGRAYPDLIRPIPASGPTRLDGQKGASNGAGERQDPQGPTRRAVDPCHRLEVLHHCDGIGFVPTEVARTSEAKQARLAQGLDGGFIQTAEFF